MISSGTPAEITDASGLQEISFESDSAVPAALLQSLPGVRDVRIDRHRTVVRGDDETAQSLIGALAANGITIRHLRITAPSLDDAFLRLTRDDLTTHDKDRS